MKNVFLAGAQRQYIYCYISFSDSIISSMHDILWKCIRNTLGWYGIAAQMQNKRKKWKWTTIITVKSNTISLCLVYLPVDAIVVAITVGGIVIIAHFPDFIQNIYVFVLLSSFVLLVGSPKLPNKAKHLQFTFTTKYTHVKANGLLYAHGKVEIRKCSFPFLGTLPFVSSISSQYGWVDVWS